MNNLRTLLITSAVLALTAIPAQAAPAAGSYKLTVGANAACPVTLAADGTVTGDCAQSHVAKWEGKADGVELFTASGETVAVLKVKNGGYAGTRFVDGRSLVLSSDASAVATSH